MPVKGTKLSEFPIASSPPGPADTFVGVQSPATDVRYTPAQAASAIGPLLPPVRTILTQPTSYYVNASTGNDSTGDGSSGNPWQTLTHANHFLQTNIDFGGQRVDLILQVPGTYPTSVDVNNNVDWGGYIGSGILSIHGATNAPASYVVTDSTHVYNGNACFSFPFSTDTHIRIDQLTMKPIQNASGAIYVNSITFVFVAGFFDLASNFALDFSDPGCNGVNAFETVGGELNIGGTCAVTVPTGGNTVNSWYVANSSQTGNAVLEGFATYTFNAGFTVRSFGFCQVGAAVGGVMLGSGDTYTFTSGSVTGPRFTVANEGFINTFGSSSGLNYFPGSTAGKVTQGGQYVIS
jgi:hypothetical protein